MQDGQGLGPDHFPYTFISGHDDPEEGVDIEGQSPKCFISSYF